jgi:hypothetical protein
MTKLVLAFLVGVIAGSIGIQLQEQRVERNERNAALARGHLDARRSAQALDVAATREERASANIQNASRASSPTPSHAQQSATPSAESETRRDTHEDHPAAANADEPDIPITEAHQPLLSSTYDGRTLGELREKLEGEAEDTAWSYEKEQQLSEFFTPPHGVPFDVRSIECRATMCEIQAFALGPMQQNTVMEDLQREPWYDFSRSFTELGHHNGSTSVLMYLMREG